jgi:hypothetical protein
VEGTLVAQFEALPRILFFSPKKNGKNNKKFVTAVTVKILKGCFPKESQDLDRLNIFRSMPGWYIK